MYRLLTANGGSQADWSLTGIGTAHGRSLALYVESDEAYGGTVLRLECIVGPREGEVLVTRPFHLVPRGDALERQWYFFRRLRLEVGVWRIALEDAGGLRLPGAVRTIRVEDSP